MYRLNYRVSAQNDTRRFCLWFLVLTITLILSPFFNPHQTVQAAIDETMPDSIPLEISADWEDQDGITGSDYASATSAIIGKLPAQYVTLFNTAKVSVTGEKNLYYLACHYRRVAKMKPYSDDLSNIMFARHHNFDGFLVGYHDNVSAGQTDASWTAKGALCILKMTNYYSTPTDLLAKTDAVVRDPCISFDGKKVLYAMSGAAKGTGYKIYEMDIADPASITQLTKDDLGGAVVADFEPCYLPNGDIAFTSTRNFGMVAHGSYATTNMFLMDGTGKYMRRVGFDQVHTFYPVLRDDGTILYTRWEYNDRSLLNNMGLFGMNPDGCHQTEFFGNQTSWPFTKIHARPIPGSNKIIAVAGGYHAPYSGELMIIDPNRGENGAQAIQMIAPKRETRPVNMKPNDASMGDVAFLFQNPLPLDENNFIVSWRKSETVSKYQLYFMDVDGNRELLAWADQSVSQPVFIKARKTPPSLVTQADYSKTTSIFTMLDVYKGAGLKKEDGTIVARGTAKSLRVVKLNYRIQGGSIGTSMGSGTGAPEPNYVPAITCPISQYGASWESKTVLGEAPIFSDGSAAFIVPARTPVYFQVLDSLGYCIATMRSWSTLMPGEQFPCLGCHESKTEPDPGVKPLAGEPKPLVMELGIEDQYFDYPKFVQPIWDAHCITCHKANHESGFDLRGDLASSSASKKWSTSYNSLMKGICFATSNKALNICTIFSKPEQQPAYSFGSSQSPIMTKILNGTHHDIKLTDKEKRIVACWIDLCAPHAGYYNNYMSASDSTKYAQLLQKRVNWETLEAANIKAMPPATAVSHGFINTKGSHSSTQQIGIQYISKERVLVLNKPGEGNLMIVDLRGKVIYSVRLSSQYVGELSVSLPSSLGAGTYMARFEGAEGIEQTKISVTK